MLGGFIGEPIGGCIRADRVKPDEVVKVIALKAFVGRCGGVFVHSKAAVRVYVWRFMNSGL